MQSNIAVDSAAAPASLGDDIVFNCPKCGAALVVTCAAAGVVVNCQKCNQLITVPEAGVTSKDEAASSEPNAHLANLQRRLKENESQRTEITSYINQHSIQLHRWQLRLQTLEERKKELMNEILASS
jgi:DNA-directed RNA polymerase subunit M/transcription elongation factor TFIIS